MCEPTVIAIAGTAIAAGSSIASFASQASAAKENKEQALKAMVESWTDIGMMQQQLQSQATAAMDEAQKRTTASASLAKTAAGAANVAGLSVDALLSDLASQGATYKESVRLQTVRQTAQLQREKVSGRTAAQNRIAAYPSPNPFALGLRIGSLGVDLASTIEKNKKP